MRRKKTREEFIAEARKVHGYKYDYSLVEYVDFSTPVRIICPIHGEFWQRPSDHLACKEACYRCRGVVKTTEEFIEEARKVHGDRYDYSQADFKSMIDEITIICPKHGPFSQIVRLHLKGSGCPKCVGRGRTTAEFIAKAKEVHGDRFDYSQTKYIDTKTPVTIVCSEHGTFQMLPHNHLKGQGCPKCTFTRSTEDFIRNARKIFGDKYDYSKVDYKTAQDFVTIICPEHGEFRIRACNHIQGHGCAKCSKNQKYTTDTFIEAAKKVHGDYYDYSESVYVNAKTKVRIICPKHGPFLQNPNNHLRGVRCPRCGGEIGGQKITSNTEEFIKKATAIHGDKYDFSKVNYTAAIDKVPVICKEHGEFWMTPQNILAGHGCPICAGNIQLNTAEFIKRSNEIHDGIYLIKAKGHTKGNSIIIVEMDGLFYMIHGDITYVDEALYQDKLSVVFDDLPAARETQNRIREFIRNHPTVYCGTHTPQGYENLEAKRVMDLDNPVPTILAEVDFSKQEASGKYVCSICGYVYDPAEHDGVTFEDLPDDWRCPRCKQPKEKFNPA